MNQIFFRNRLAGWVGAVGILQASVSGFATVTAVHRAVESIPGNEKYPDHEIENRKSDRFSHGVKAAGYGAMTFGAAAGRQPARAAGCAAVSAGHARDCYEAHQDVKKMEEHNSRASSAQQMQQN